MTDTSDNKEPADTSTATAAQPTHKNPVSAAISHLNLTQLTLLVVIILFAWQWVDSKQQSVQMQNLLAQKLSDIDGSNKATQTLTQQSQEQVRDLGAKLSLLDNKYAETQSQRSALESLYQDLSSSRDQMILAEVEQLLLIAGQQLQLSANVKAALIAMQHADNRLQRLNRPALAQLRNAIGRDMDKLRSLPDADISALNYRLDNLINLIDQIPLIQDIRIAHEDNTTVKPRDIGAFENFWREFWNDAKHLVRIENTQRSELPLIAPDQIFFLRENLKLRLLAARLELLSRDETGFKRDIKAAQEWVKKYFDAQSSEGSQALNHLQKLNNSHIKIDLPDISNSLEVVRHYRASREKDTR